MTGHHLHQPDTTSDPKTPAFNVALARDPLHDMSRNARKCAGLSVASAIACNQLPLCTWAHSTSKPGLARVKVHVVFIVLLHQYHNLRKSLL